LNQSQTDRRAELLAAGLRLFSARAYDELSIDEIAAEAGVANGLLYYYFGSKRGLYVAVVEHAARELRERTEPDPALPPLERLAAGLSAYLAYVAERSAGFRTLLTGGVGADPQVRAIVERERGVFLERLLADAGRAPPALRAALHGWVSFVEGASLEWLADRELRPEQMRELLLRALDGAVAAARAVDPTIATLAAVP
jgi:AcrR family transcriptional regulator